MINPNPKGSKIHNPFPNNTPIGIFDSGIGGLTILKEIVKKLPQYDYIYLGDNARAPYGTRSFETVYQYTLECVQKLFDMNCQLVILACTPHSQGSPETAQTPACPTARSRPAPPGWPPTRSSPPARPRPAPRSTWRSTTPRLVE